MNTKQSTREEYQKRLNIVIEYINSNLGESIDLRTLSEISNFSEFHFHRIFKAFVREPLGSYITRLRLETAAHQLRYSEIPIEEIAYKVGYEVPSSLSKSFKQLYGISPKEYRADKNYFIMKKINLNPDFTLKAPKILELEPKKAIYIRLTGAYSDLDFPGTFAKLWAYVK